jgi:3',5'-cyclic AMP phosphodiesterase CpdA
MRERSMHIVRPVHRVLHVSDTHLSSTESEGLDAWKGLVKYTEGSRPDLVVHTGDLVFDDPDSEEDHDLAAAQWRRLTVPSRVIPGNHDVGDSPPDPYRGLASTERLDRYRRHYGADRWSLRLGAWLLIGLNSQLFGTGLDAEEDEQWQWFDDQLASHSDARLAVFMHKPPCIASLDEPTVANKTISAEARARMLELARFGRLRLIGCGHLHEFMTLTSYGVLVVAAPSLAAGSRPVPTRGLGLRCNGAVEYVFDDGGVRFQLLHQSELRAPEVPESEAM